MVINFCDACGKTMGINGVQGSAQFLPKGQPIGVTMCDSCWEKMTARWDKLNKVVTVYKHKLEVKEDEEQNV